MLPRFGGSSLLAALLAAILASQGIAQQLVDTVGFAARDRQMYGPAVRFIARDTFGSTHVIWKDGTSSIRYNFRPRGGQWRWTNGCIVNRYPRNLGSLDVHPGRGTALISTDFLSRNVPTISIFTDSAAGAGVFTESEVATGYRDALIGTANFGYTKLLAKSNDSIVFRSYLTYFRVGYLGAFPSYNVAVSKQRDVGRYGCIWAVSDGPNKGALYLRITPNNGSQWFPTVALSESMPPSALRHSLFSGCGTFDSLRIHVVAGTYDGVDVHRSQLWHYCPYDTPAWHLIHDYSLPQSVDIGDFALAACRPSIGLNRRSDDNASAGYFAVWEQFDPVNIDPATGLSRADIWVARSMDMGHTWGLPVRLTVPDETSKRFPFLAEFVDDTLHILYFADRVAGCWEQHEGPQTVNPVVYVRVSAKSVPVAVRDAQPVHAGIPGVHPTISVAGFTANAPRGLIRRIRLFDCTGRSVADLRPGKRALTFGQDLSLGVYLATVESDDGVWSGRLVKPR